MTRACSLDLRDRVVSAFLSGEPCRSVANDLMCQLPASRVGGHLPWLLKPERDWPLQRLGEKPDLTLMALLRELSEVRDVHVSHDTLWLFLGLKGFSFDVFPLNSSRLR
jgi:hypothetical protein